MAPPKLSKFLWDSTSDEFLDLLRHILELTTTRNRNNPEISVLGRSGCGLSINMKKVGKERTLSKLGAISQHAMQS